MTSPDYSPKNIDDEFYDIVRQLSHDDLYQDYDKAMGEIYQLILMASKDPGFAIGPVYDGAINHRLNVAKESFKKLIEQFGQQYGFGSEEFIEASAEALIRADQDMMEFVSKNLPGCDFSRPHNEPLEDLVTEIAEEFEEYTDKYDSQDSDYSDLLVFRYSAYLDADIETIYGKFCEDIIRDQGTDKASVRLDGSEVVRSGRNRWLGSVAVVLAGAAGGATFYTLSELFGRLGQ